MNYNKPVRLILLQCPVVVIGNKYDLDGIRDVDISFSTQWAKTNGGKIHVDIGGKWVYYYSCFYHQLDYMRRPC